MAKAFGANISRNPDGSFDVNAPLLDMLNNPQQATPDILSTVMGGLLNPGSSKGSRSGLEALGMNSLQAQAWMGWPEENTQDSTPDNPVEEAIEEVLEEAVKEIIDQNTGPTP